MTDLDRNYYDADGDIYVEDLVGDIESAARAEGMHVKATDDRVYVSRDGRQMGYIEVTAEGVNWNGLSRNKAGIRDAILPHIT